MKLDLHFKTWVKKSFSEFAKKKKNPLTAKFTFTCLSLFYSMNKLLHNFLCNT